MADDNCEKQKILIVDDTPENIDILGEILADYKKFIATNGERALKLAKEKLPDLILLDIMMPGMDGFEVCTRLKADDETKEIPVIFITAKNQIEDEVRGLELGAVDFISKPISPPKVLARVKSHLELKSSRKKIELKNRELLLEQEKSENLLLNIFPKIIVERLKSGENKIADIFDEASVIFLNIVDFTKISDYTKPEEIVDLLNRIFTEIDHLAAKYGIEKIKTIGDSYMAVSGIPVPMVDHALKAADFGKEIMRKFKNYQTVSGTNISLRIGINCGPVVAGVIGEKKFIYDLWGDTVNTASRMEENGEPHKIQVTECFKNKLTESLMSVDGQDKYLFQERGKIDIKGKGMMNTWWLLF